MLKRCCNARQRTVRQDDPTTLKSTPGCSGGQQQRLQLQDPCEEQAPKNVCLIMKDWVEVKKSNSKAQLKR